MFLNAVKKFQRLEFSNRDEMTINKDLYEFERNLFLSYFDLCLKQFFIGDITDREVADFEDNHSFFKALIEGSLSDIIVEKIKRNTGACKYIRKYIEEYMEDSEIIKRLN